MLTAAERERIFKEAANGFGFTEIEQSGDGTYCHGCLCVHKRPTKMYSNNEPTRPVIMCKSAVVYFYNPED